MHGITVTSVSVQPKGAGQGGNVRSSLSTVAGPLNMWPFDPMMAPWEVTPGDTGAVRHSEEGYIFESLHTPLAA